MYQAIQQVTKNKPQIQLTVGISDSQGTAIKVYGVEKELAETGQRYEIGSLTKIFTTSLMSKYLCNGTLNLTNSLATYFPNLPKEGYYPTIQRLATHTSGYQPHLPYSRMAHIKILGQAILGGGNPFRGNTPFSQLEAALCQTKLVDKDYPFAYANLNYSILGCLLAQVSQTSYVDLMTAWLRDELKLGETNFSEEAVLPAYNTFGKRRENWLWEMEDTAIAAGGLYGTAENLLRFAQYHNQHHFDYLQSSHQRLAQGTAQYDMAFGWKKPQQSPILWHNGGTGCFSSFLGFNHQSKKEVVILSNYRSLKIDPLGLKLLTEV